MRSRKQWAILIGMSDSWPDEVTARMAAEIKRLRGERSGQWLSDRTAELGHRVSRSTISEIETGRRKSITITDLIILAVALHVPPIRLLYPDLPDGMTEFVPGKEVTSIEAVQWFSGEVPYVRTLAEGEVEIKDVQEVRQGVRVLELARERAALEGQIRLYSDMAERARKSKNPAMADMAFERLETAQKRIEVVGEELRRVDGAVVGNAG
jgi:transcriptional regulator with XRE-family HTH domain